MSYAISCAIFAGQRCRFSRVVWEGEVQGAPALGRRALTSEGFTFQDAELGIPVAVGVRLPGAIASIAARAPSDRRF